MIEGIAVTIIGAIIIGCYTIFSKKNQKSKIRKEQIAHLRNLLSESIEKIETAKPFSAPEANRAFTAEQMMFVYYEELRRNLDPCLEKRSTEITYDEKKQITDPFFPIEFARQQGIAPNKNAYDQCFEKLRAVKWLGM